MSHSAWLPGASATFTHSVPSLLTLISSPWMRLCQPSVRLTSLTRVMACALPRSMRIHGLSSEAV